MKRMKWITALFLLSGLMLQAQEKSGDGFSYLFSGAKHSFSGFGAPLTMFAQAEDGFAVYSGGGGALLIDQRFFIGGYGMGLATRHLHEEVELYGTHYDRLRTNFGHGGFWLGYIHQPANMVHLAFSAKLGWGELALYDDRFEFDQYDYHVRDAVFVVTPQLEVELNLTRWFKLNVGAGYQLVTGVNGHRYSDTEELVFLAEDYSSPEITIGLVFGGFGKE